MLPDPVSPDAVRLEINVLPMHFRSEYLPKKGEPGEYEEVHKVDLVKKGSNGDATPHTIRSLQKDMVLWPFVKPYYDRWLEGQEDPVEGTPIDVLPFLPRGVAQHLRNLLIRSAEDLANTTDADLERIGMGARGWREKARSYVEAKNGEAKMASVNADLRSDNERMQKEIDELKTLVNQLTPPERKGGKKDAPE